MLLNIVPEFIDPINVIYICISGQSRDINERQRQGVKLDIGGNKCTQN